MLVKHLGFLITPSNFFYNNHVIFSMEYVTFSMDHVIFCLNVFINSHKKENCWRDSNYTRLKDALESR